MANTRPTPLLHPSALGGWCGGSGLWQIAVFRAAGCRGWPAAAGADSPAVKVVEQRGRFPP